MHKGLTAHDAEERISLLLRFGDELVHCWQIDRLLLAGDIDPASLTPQIAAVDNGDIQKWWKELPFLHASSVFEYG